MFVTNKRVKKLIPAEILVDGSLIKVVDSFKLLGVTIDDKLNFNKYSRDLRLIVNKKLYSIQKLFYLCTAVKLQFFKSFIMPYFDYCLSLYIYFPKTTIQRINNCFNLCLFKLFKIKMNTNVIDFNNDLNKYGLSSFQHRIVNKVFTFAYNIINNPKAPTGLKQTFVNSKVRRLRKNNLELRAVKTHYGEKTFSYFFVNLYNSFSQVDFHNEFKKIYSNFNSNIKNIFEKFVNIYPIFNIFYKN